MDELFGPHFHFDPQRQVFFVDLMLIFVICPSTSNPNNFARTITNWINSVIGVDCTLNDVYLPKGITSGNRGTPSRHGMLRRDYFDILMMSAVGPKLLKLTWTTARIRYINLSYPNVPIPGVSAGFPCQYEHERARMLAAFPGQ